MQGAKIMSFNVEQEFRNLSTSQRNGIMKIIAEASRNIQNDPKKSEEYINVCTKILEAYIESSVETALALTNVCAEDYHKELDNFQKKYTGNN